MTTDPEARSQHPEPVIAGGIPGRLGPFRLVAELGRGGFAPVWLAAEEYGGVEIRTVALKVFVEADASAEAEAARAQVIAEARALCRVEHPHVVRFYQLVETPEAIALAMEHVRGTSLADRLAREGRIPVAEALAFGAAVASALAAIHASGIVHRDVKPANVLEAAGTTKLIDFGIATEARRAADAVRRAVFGGDPARDGATPLSLVPRATRRDVTLAGAQTEELPGGDDAATHDNAGTMGYVDPICLRVGQRADASSDLYALGAMLYECLTGLLPASDGPDGVDRIRLDVALGTEPPPPIQIYAPDLPAEVAELVMALVAPDPRDRPRSAESVASELERLRRIVGPRGAQRELPPEGPFRGLLPFDVRDRDVYFGRSGEIASAIALLRMRSGLVLVGLSGAGKSSLARAGVVPAVVAGALGPFPKRWTVVAMSPGPSPREALRRALEGIVDLEPDDDPRVIAAALRAHVERSGEGLLFFVDALEELVTIAKHDEAAALAELVAELSARTTPGLRVLGTARRDLLDPLLGLDAFGPALAKMVQLVTPLGHGAWMEALEERLRVYSFRLETPAMRDALARELEGTNEAMPLVEFAFAKLWEARDESARVIPASALVAMGGLAGALTRHAEETLASLGESTPAAEFAERLLVSLTTPHGTRDRHTAEELGVDDPEKKRVLDVLERARLVVRVDDGLTLAHDALITQWPRLRVWIDALRRDRETARDVEEAATRWEANPERGLLLRGQPLRDARALLRSENVALSARGARFVTTSRRSDLRDRIGIFSLVASVLLAAVVMLALYRQKDREAAAQQRLAIDTTRELLRKSPNETGALIERLTRENFVCKKELATYKDAGAP